MARDEIPPLEDLEVAPDQEENIKGGARLAAIPSLTFGTVRATGAKIVPKIRNAPGSGGVIANSPVGPIKP